MDSKYSRLSRIVYEHENFWSRLAQRLPTKNGRAVMLDFFRKTWDPWYSRFVEYQHRDLTDAEQASLADEASSGLSAIRDKARKRNIPVPELTAIAVSGSGLMDSLVRLLTSPQAMEVQRKMLPIALSAVPGMATLTAIDKIVSDANGGNPVAVEIVKEVKTRSDAGDPAAKQTALTMAAVSRVQKKKRASTGTSLYARGMSVGHDPYAIVGTVRDHRPVSSRPTPPAGQPYAPWQPSANLTIPGFKLPGTTRVPTRQPPATPPQQSQPQPFPGYGQPYPPGQGYPPPGYGYPPPGQYGGYPPPFDPYAMYGLPYGGLPGLPPGYGTYEEPIVDRGGYQQYDPATDSFFSSNQKQVYDESTGMFYPAPSQNPYYGF